MRGSEGKGRCMGKEGKMKGVRGAEGSEVVWARVKGKCKQG